MLQLVRFHAEGRGGGVAGLGGEEADGGIAPVVQQPPAAVFPFVLKLVELEDGHELHAVDPQLFQVGDLFRDAREGARMADAGGGMGGKGADVHLIDDQVGKGKPQGRVALPVVILPDDLAPVDEVRSVLLLPAPDAAAGNGFGIGIQQDLRGIEAVALLRRPGAVEAVAVFHGVDVQAEDQHREHVPDAEAVRERDLREGLRLAVVIQHQGASRGVLGIDAEIHPAVHQRGAEGKHLAGAVFQAAGPVGRKSIDPSHG